MKRKGGYRKKQRRVGTVTHQQGGSIKLSFQGQLIFPVVTQHSSARKTPPSPSEASTWLLGPLTLAPHCAWAGRGGRVRDRDSPKVTEQKWPVPRCPSTLRKGLSMLCPIQGRHICTPPMPALQQPSRALPGCHIYF
ncbi:rCG22049 [Rattus norvegicus]|uniref:RCG22049 n=1 Tax=Rattus norvegicus TaxID=10116 RepID=A6K3Y3_RAT|nr:rCG22049 [Rattus norvegicus]